MKGRFCRLDETARPIVSFSINGKAACALEGDTLLVAILTNVGHVRISEFGDGERAGFCLMGACQDCWVSTRTGDRLRACTTPVAAGMDIVLGPEGAWPNFASS